jgi:prepilin-type N-terminal cleavage/methylation domain-containing protein
MRHRRDATFTTGVRSGMSLVELVVGLAITGLMLAAGYAAFGSILDHRERATESTLRLAREAAVRQTIVGWLAGARVTGEAAGPGFSGIDGLHGNVPDAELRILTAGATPSGSGAIVVRLFIERDDASSQRGLVAEVSAWAGEWSERIELERRAVGLEIRYLSSAAGPRQWLPSWISSSVLPAGVELRLVAATADTLPPLLALPILVAYGGAP